MHVLKKLSMRHTGFGGMPTQIGGLASAQGVLTDKDMLHLASCIHNVIHNIHLSCQSIS
jgi:hypothetical protein